MRPSTLPKLSAYVCCLGTEVGLYLDDIVLHGDPATPPSKGGGVPPQFSAHVYCGQTAG